MRSRAGQQIFMDIYFNFSKCPLIQVLYNTYLRHALVLFSMQVNSILPQINFKATVTMKNKQ